MHRVLFLMVLGGTWRPMAMCEGFSDIEAAKPFPKTSKVTKLEWKNVDPHPHAFVLGNNRHNV